MESQTKRSEIAHVLNQIEAEYLAAQRGLTGFAESAKHRIITARMENIGQLHEHLCTIAGDEATRLMADRLEHIPAGKEAEKC